MSRYLSKAYLYIKLMRFHHPIGFMLLLWPTLWALWLIRMETPNFKTLIMFITGVFITRSAGCVINDYFDYKIDSTVLRTKLRPISNKKISHKEAFLLFMILIFIDFFIILNMNNINTIFFSFFTLMIIIIYPFMKRYTHFPQIILGIAFSSSILIVWIEINNKINYVCYLLFFSNFFWTIAYDTQYALMDYQDDIRIGIKSTAVFFRKKNQLFIIILQFLMLFCISIIGFLKKMNYFFWLSILLSLILFIYQYSLLNQKNNNFYYRAFSNNNYVGLILFLGFILNTLPFSY